MRGLGTVRLETPCQLRPGKWYNHQGKHSSSPMGRRSDNRRPHGKLAVDPLPLAHFQEHLR
jgi:hypothetical protein